MNWPPNRKSYFLAKSLPQILCKPLSVQAHRATSSRWMHEANYRPPRKLFSGASGLSGTDLWTAVLPRTRMHDPLGAQKA